MKQKLSTLLCLTGLLGGAGWLKADQLTSILYVQNGATINLQSQRGVPISTVTNAAAGSDGQMPTTLTSNDANNGAPVTPSTNQFRGFLSYGGVHAPTNLSQLTNYSSTFLSGRTNFSPGVALAMQLPMFNFSNGTYLVERRAQIGAPYFGRQVTYPFGSVIPTPVTDTSGVLLTNPLAGYWQSVPWPEITPQFTPGSNIVNYYYSPSAGQVFAAQPGPITVTWVTAASSGNSDANWRSYTNLNAPPGTPSFYTNSSSIYRLYTANYVISSTPVKPPHSIFWTEGNFTGLGYPVALPQGRVSGLHFAYNNSVPATVPVPYQDPNGSSVSENRTLWVAGAPSTGILQVHAYNVQGEVFVELLGDPIAGSSASQYLGFEIVQIYQSPLPANITVNLGDQLTPFQDGWEGTSPAPSAIGNPTGQQFYYQLITPNGSQLYADRFTPDPNDMQVYWLNTGVAGLQWPDRFVTYAQVWPSDPALYSHYLRSTAATPAEAALTAVTLDAAEAPSLDYQDPLDQARGFLSGNKFYTWLTPAEPVHRALLRFNANGNVRFERVFSWLDQTLESNNFAGTLATNFPSVAAYPVAYSNYLVAYNNYLVASNNYSAAYSNYLHALSRGVNGRWQVGYQEQAGLSGSIASCAVIVQSAAPGGGFLTNEFDGPGLTIAPSNSGLANITVSGITNPVTDVSLVFKGLTHPQPAGLVLGAFGPKSVF